jgi:hypothetical protein
MELVATALISNVSAGGAERCQGLRPSPASLWLLLSRMWYGRLKVGKIFS